MSLQARPSLGGIGRRVDFTDGEIDEHHATCVLVLQRTGLETRPTVPMCNVWGLSVSGVEFEIVDAKHVTSDRLGVAALARQRTVSGALPVRARKTHTYPHPVGHCARYL